MMNVQHPHQPSHLSTMRTTTSSEALVSPTTTTTTTRIAHLIHVNTDAAMSMVRRASSSSWSCQNARQSSLRILSRGLAQILPQVASLQQQQEPPEAHQHQHQHAAQQESRLVYEPLHVNNRNLDEDDDDNDDESYDDYDVDRQQGIYYSSTDGLQVYARPLVVRFKHHHNNKTSSSSSSCCSSSSSTVADFSLADLELLAAVMMYNMALCLHVKALEAQQQKQPVRQEQAIKDKPQSVVVLLRKALALYEKTMRFFMLLSNSSLSSSISNMPISSSNNKNNNNQYLLLSLAVMNNTAHIHAYFYEHTAVQHCHDWMKRALTEYSNNMMMMTHQPEQQEQVTPNQIDEDISDDESTVAPSLAMMEEDEGNEEEDNDEEEDDDLFDPSFFLLNIFCLDADLFCTAPAA